jgi:hypothetical protein
VTALACSVVVAAAVIVLVVGVLVELRLRTVRREMHAARVEANRLFVIQVRSGKVFGVITAARRVGTCRATPDGQSFSVSAADMRGLWNALAEYDSPTR